MANTGTFNLGTDQSVVITNLASGATVTLDGRRSSFTSESKDKLHESDSVDNGGLVDHRWQPRGYQGTIEVERYSDDFSALQAFLDASFYNGAPQTFFTIESYEPKADRSAVAVYQFTRVVFHGYKPGTWANDKVKPSVSFAAQERKKVG